MGSTSGIRACCEALNKKKQPIHPRSISDKIEAGTTTTNLTARLPILNPADYDLWLIRIEQYFLMTNYSIWEVIKNEEKQDKRNEIKARATLLMALPNKDQLKFHSYQDAKLLMEAMEKRYGGNKESKKLLRSLPSEWKTHALIWRNKVEIETISLDNLYNNLKIYEPELTGSSSTSQNSQNVAFVSSNSTNSTNNTNKADNTAYGVKMDLQWEMAMLTIRDRRFIKRTGRKLDINGQRVGFDKFPRNQENKGRENNTRIVTVETPTQYALIAQDGIGGYDWSYQAEEEHPTNFTLIAYTSYGSSFSLDSEVDSCSKTCLESVEARLAHYKKNEDVFEESINVLKLEVRLRDNALVNQVSDMFKTGLGYNAVSSTIASPAVESFVNSSQMLENQEYNKSKFDKGYHAVPPPLTGNLIPSKPDLMFMDEIVESKNMDVTTVVTPSNDKTVENKGVYNIVESNEVIEFGDSYKASPDEPGKGSTGEGSAKKKARTVAITAEDMQKRKNDVKARTTLLLALPNEHQLRFSKYDNAKDIWEAILKTFGGNEATNKTKKNQLKQ
ncbi:hypothetical protein Tco_0330899 [Tanacetum coccineum]